MITYREAPLTVVTWRLDVLLEGRVIGSIKDSFKPRGYQYCPKGSKVKGEVFSTISEVKRSIEHG